MSTPYNVRPIGDHLGWRSNVGKYFRYAHALLEELELKHSELVAIWPVPKDTPLQDMHLHYPDVQAVADARDHLSDSVRIYAAMAMEGFLNMYGVLRLREEFDYKFERLGPLPKVEKLLLVCDGLTFPAEHPLLTSLDALAKSRNVLVHPESKIIETMEDVTAHSERPAPWTARESVRNMNVFFTEFLEAVPEAAQIAPKRSLPRPPNS